MPHVRGDDRLVAAVAIHRWLEVVSALEMGEDQRGLPPREPAVSPSQHCDEGTVEVPSHVGQKIFVPVRRTLVVPAVEDAPGDKAAEPISEDVRRDRKFGLYLIVTTVTEETLSEDHKAPLVADDLKGPRHRTRAAKNEPAAFRRPSGVAARLGGATTSTGAITILCGVGFDALAAMGAGDDRMAVATACRVNQRQRGRLVLGQPPVPELPEGDEA